MNSKHVFYESNTSCCKSLFFNFYITIILLTAINFAVIVSAGFAAEETRVRWISIANLNQIIEEQEPVIIDLRTPAEFKRGCIPEAINIPIEVLRSDRSALDAYKGKPLLLYCRTIKKTNLALWLLDNRGFKSIYALEGGYEVFRQYKS